MSAEFDLPLVRPSLPSMAELQELLAEGWRTGMVTTGPLTRRFEAALQDKLGVRHAVMVNHGTTALMLAARALRLTGEVIVPGFTWTATAGALRWNNVEPVFADIEPGRLTLDPAAAEAAITPRTSAIMPVNVFGVPPDMDAFEEIGRRHDIPILYDSAQGLGATYRGRYHGGFGAAECFSMSPTKVVTAVEGGIVTTNDDRVAEEVRSMRDSGKNADSSDIVRLGLSGRPSEMHAAVAVAMFAQVEALIARRMELFGWYREALAGIPGLKYQEIPEDVTTTGNYFVILVDQAEARIERDELYRQLGKRKIQVKRYFYPAIHLQEAYSDLRARYAGRLPVTEKAAAEGIALPLFNAMRREDVERVAAAVADALGVRALA